MKRFVSKLPLIPVCALLACVVHAADAPQDEMQSVAIAAARARPDEKPDTQLSLAGIGSLFWAVRHPAQAWKVLLPVQPLDGTDVSTDIRERCALFATAALDQKAVSP